MCSRALLRSMTRSDLRFPLATGLPVGRVSYASVCLLSSTLGIFVRPLLASAWFSSLFCLRDFLSSPSLSSVASYRSLFGSVIRCIFSVFSSRSAVLDYLLLSSCLSFVVLPDSSVGFFCGFLP